MLLNACNGNEYRLDSLRARALPPRVRAARRARGAAARAGGRPARHVDRDARALVLRARGRHRGLSRASCSPTASASPRHSARSPRRSSSRSAWSVSRAARARATTASRRSLLVAALAGGVVLASDVFHSGGNIDSLLFGSLLLTGTRDLVLAGARERGRGRRDARARAALARPGVRPGLRTRARPALGPARCAAARARRLRGRSPRSRRSAPCSRPRCSSCLLPPCASGRSACRSGRRTSVALAAAQGHRRPVALGRAEHPARDRRSPCSAACCSPLSVAWRSSAPIARRRAALAAAAALVALVRGRLRRRRRRRPTRARRSSRRRRRSATGRAQSPARRRACTRSSSPTPTRTTTSRGRPTCEAVAGAKIVFVNGDGLDAWMGTVISNSGGSPVVVDLGAKVPVRLPGESEGREASRYDPHWWHDPRNAEAAVRAIRDALVAADPAAASELSRERRGIPAPPARARRRHSLPVWQACRAARAQARLGPRRVRLLRAALRHHRRRRRDPVADDAGAGLRRRHRQARRA